MSCPTCDHTMERLCDWSPCDGSIFLCPRCGTVKMEDGDRPAESKVYVPKLVERCRKFEIQEIVGCVSREVDKWHSLGIAESLHKPEDRPR